MNYSYPLIFWLIVQLFGLIGLPVAFSLFKNLPDRGYVFAKPLGLLLVGYTLWLAGSLGLFHNNLGGTLLALAIVTGLGVAWYRRQGGPSLLAWLREHYRYVLVVELVFTIAFSGWTIYKSYTPNIETAGGEKWMEIAFINANLLSDSFPPQDPWLAGFGISYYYFGYVISAILIRLSGIVSTTAFNLLIPLLFALTLSGTFGLIGNMVSAHQGSAFPTRAAQLTGLLGAFLVGIMGHLHGPLEVLHARHLLSPAFWSWLDMLNLKEAPLAAPTWIPDRFIWWWRGSRVLTDYNLAGQQYELIDEFPFFSFLLGDVHPHVLALPFVLLAIALAFNLLLNGRSETLDSDRTTGDDLLTRVRGTLGHSLSALVQATGGPVGFFFYALAVGALGFLNTWDFPIYLALLGLAYLAWRRQEPLHETILGMVGLALLGGVLYLPFYVGFQSQAGGLLPNLWNPTYLPQFLVFFGPFLLLILAFVGRLTARQAGWRAELRWTGPLFILGPVVAALILALPFLITPSGQGYVAGLLSDQAVQANLGGNTTTVLIREILSRRIHSPWTFLLLVGLLAWIVAYFWSRVQPVTVLGSRGRAELFALVLLTMGLLLPLAVEFVFIRDVFNNRMNTVFKFYFQAWVLLALGAAFGVYYLHQAWSGLRRWAWEGLVAILVLLGLVYPVLATLNRANNFRGQPTLDGIAWVAQAYPDDHAAILWLRQNAPPEAVILEAPGGGYQYEGRISALTGRPTVLGWAGHEHQWRGTYEEPGRRQPDIETLYNTLDVETTLTLLDKYDITYVYVGPLERATYNPSGLAKFDALLDVAFAQGDVVIYERPGS